MLSGGQVRPQRLWEGRREDCHLEGWIAKLFQVCLPPLGKGKDFGLCLLQHFASISTTCQCYYLVFIGFPSLCCRKWKSKQISFTPCPAPAHLVKEQRWEKTGHCLQTGHEVVWRGWGYLAAWGRSCWERQSWLSNSMGALSQQCKVA